MSCFVLFLVALSTATINNAAIPGRNLLANSRFAGKGSPWILQHPDNCDGTFTVIQQPDGKRVAEVEVTRVVDGEGGFSFGCGELFKIKPNTSYRFKAKMKSDFTKPVKLELNEIKENRRTRFGERFDEHLTVDWQTVECVFKSDRSAEACFVITSFGRELGKLWLAEPELTEELSSPKN